MTICGHINDVKLANMKMSVFACTRVCEAAISTCSCSVDTALQLDTLHAVRDVLSTVSYNTAEYMKKHCQ